MKKIHLSIPKPCHEDWNAMTPSDIGRFCGSCQKTVIDFTNMSDRQLAEFFKKSPSSVCGRVYDDQLHRDIIIPRKRIPWIRYFFQFTWPAFVLFLKSCGVKHDAKDKVIVESKADDVQEYPYATLGVMMTEIAPVDTAVVIKEEQLVPTLGLIGDMDVTPITDSIVTSIDSLTNETEIAYKPMDTVVVQSYGGTIGRMVISGAMSVCKSDTIYQEEVSLKQELQSDEEIKYKVYPNPVRAGSSLNVAFERGENLPEGIQILSSAGQLISQAKQNDKTMITDIQIPSNCSAGIYFLRMVTKNKKVKTTKVIVTK